MHNKVYYRPNDFAGELENMIYYSLKQPCFASEGKSKTPMCVTLSHVIVPFRSCILSILLTNNNK